MRNILTIDVEDYFQVHNFQKVVRFEDWDKCESRVLGNTERILEILNHSEARATFFILGWVAERLPQLVKNIKSAGHEIASHGYAHRLIYSQTPDEFRQDIRKSKAILEDIIQQPVLGYRAPCYSITRQSLWALDILMEEGFKYDSSLFPIRHDKGGMLEADRHPHKIYNHRNFIWELPISTIRCLGQNIPFSGGGYFRLLPYSFIRYAIGKVNKENSPAIVYIHPWELDTRQPKINAGAVANFRHRVNIGKMDAKIRGLLGDFEFESIKTYIEGKPA